MERSTMFQFANCLFTMGLSMGFSNGSQHRCGLWGWRWVPILIPRIPNLASIPRSCRGFVDPLEIGRKSLGDFCGNAIKMVESSMWDFRRFTSGFSNVSTQKYGVFSGVACSPFWVLHLSGHIMFHPRESAGCPQWENPPSRSFWGIVIVSLRRVVSTYADKKGLPLGLSSNLSCLPNAMSSPGPQVITISQKNQLHPHPRPCKLFKFQVFPRYLTMYNYLHDYPLVN